MLAELRREDGGSGYGDTSGAGAAGHDGSCENSSSCGKHCAVLSKGHSRGPACPVVPSLLSVEKPRPA